MTSTCLSSEISRARSIAAGGAHTQNVNKIFRLWPVLNPDIQKKRGGDSLLAWSRNITLSLEKGEILGVPAGRLLSEIHPMVRREERIWARLSSLEKQYGFQGAIAMVLPWSVVMLIGNPSAILTSKLGQAGLAAQIIGMACFYFVIRKATTPLNDEKVWLRNLMTAIWMRVLCGLSLMNSIDSALSEESTASGPRRLMLEEWKSWLMAYKSGALQTGGFQFSTHFKSSQEGDELLRTLIASGSPSGTALQDWISQLDEECQLKLEERISSIPVTLSLIFCFILTPAVFLILGGVLWPSLQSMF